MLHHRGKKDKLKSLRKALFIALPEGIEAVINTVLQQTHGASFHPFRHTQRMNTATSVLSVL